LPSNVNAAPYCCKGRGSYGGWTYGPPYNLGDNDCIFCFLPCSFKIFPLGWLRSLFYIKSWLGGTFKGSWSMARGLLASVAGLLPKGQITASWEEEGFGGNGPVTGNNTGKPLTSGNSIRYAGGGKIGNAYKYVKGKGSNAVHWAEKKKDSAYSWLTARGKADRDERTWSFAEFAYFVVSPLLAIAISALALPVSIFTTLYASITTSLLWTFFGFAFLLLIATGNAIAMIGQLLAVLFLKGMRIATLKETTKNFFKYGRGPFIIGLMALILQKFPEIPFYVRILLISMTVPLLFYFR
jgi:hypothetical protein